MEPKLDVVVPLYNKKNHIAACISSLGRQTILPNLLIIIDDGSVDDSYAVALEALALYPGKYSIVRQVNQGVSVARNVGVDLSNAEFICFLDADDLWDECFIELMTGLIHDFSDADLFCLGHRVFDPAVGIYKPVHGFSSGFRGYLKSFFSASAKGSVANSSKVAVRRLSFLAVGGFPPGVKVGEDLYLWMKMALCGRVACDSTIAVTVQRISDNSRDGRQGKIPYPLFYFADRDNRKNLPADGVRYLARIYFLHLAEFSRLNDFKACFLLMKVAVRIFPFFVLLTSPVVVIPAPVLTLAKFRRHRLIK